MSKKNRIKLAVVFVVIIFCFGVIFPSYFNKGISFLNNSFLKPIGIKAPTVPVSGFKLGLDLKGGTSLTYEADLSKISKADLEKIPASEKESKMKQLKQIIVKRIQGRGSYGLGVSEPRVTVQEGTEGYRLSVSLPGVKDPQEAIKLIGKTPYLEFKEERSTQKRKKMIKNASTSKEVEQLPVKKACASPEFIKKFIKKHGKDPCYKSTELSGEYLKGAQVRFSQTGMNASVSLEFTDGGSKLFEEISGRNVDKVVGIYIDHRPVSLPVVNEKITQGKAQITGDFSLEEAKELANNLDMGALPVPISVISQNTIGPSLGEISLNKSIKAALFGFVLLVLFMLFVYRLPGLLASVSLLVYAGVMLTFFKIIPVTLTLAGIGGAILSVGMAVDANVLIFERQKEELKKGENFARMVKIGFSRAWPSIRDSNFTTLMVAFIMFVFGTSFIKGFATTLSLGILISLFSALFVTETFMRSFKGTKLSKIKWLWK